MAKTESPIKRFMKDDVLPFFGKILKRVIDAEIKSLEHQIHKRVEKHVQNVLLSLTGFLGLALIIVGIAIFVESFVGFPSGFGLILVGVIVALTAYILKASKTI